MRSPFTPVSPSQHSLFRVTKQHTVQRRTGLSSLPSTLPCPAAHVESPHGETGSIHAAPENQPVLRERGNACVKSWNNQGGEETRREIKEQLVSDFGRFRRLSDAQVGSGCLIQRRGTGGRGIVLAPGVWPNRATWIGLSTVQEDRRYYKTVDSQKWMTFQKSIRHAFLYICFKCLINCLQSITKVYINILFLFSSSFFFFLIQINRLSGRLIFDDVTLSYMHKLVRNIGVQIKDVYVLKQYVGLRTKDSSCLNKVWPRVKYIYPL